MGSRTIDKRDVGFSAPAQPVAELRREFETASTTANDDDPMLLPVARPFCYRHDLRRRLWSRMRARRFPSGHYNSGHYNGGRYNRGHYIGHLLHSG
jgi:hypothetical protein